MHAMILFAFYTRYAMALPFYSLIQIGDVVC